MEQARKFHFVNADKSEFYTTLRNRVDAYFKQKGISPYANSFMVFKIIFFLTGLIGTYLLLLFNNQSLVFSYFLWIMLGLFTAFVGVNICHDAIHGAISRNSKVNKVLGFLFDIAGANAYIWNITHNRIHHTYTNIQGYDADISTSSLIRMSPHQRLRKIHKYQHWYTWILYGFTTLSWVFVKDYRRFFQKHIENYQTKKPPMYEYFNLFFFKALYYTIFLILPLVFLEFAWWHIILGFVSMHFVEGFMLAIIIQMAHLVETIEFPVPNNNNEIENSWAIHQLHTTADFARNNPLVSFFFGGLNFHIEHHLFQRICHVHHRPISHILKRTAMDFSLPYHEIPSLSGALVSHLKFLKSMGSSTQ